MSLKFKLFCFIVVIPIFIIGVLMTLLSSAFVSAQTESVFENQIQALNSVHLLLNHTDSRELAKKTKAIFSQQGLESLLVSDYAGKIRYAGDPAVVGKTISEIFNTDILQKTLDKASEEGSFETVDLARKKVLVSFFKLDLGDQRVLLLLPKPKSVVTRPSYLFMYKAIAATTALFIFFFFASRWMSQSLTRGLKQVLTAMESLGHGQWQTPVPISASGEIGELARHFGSMRKLIYQSRLEEQKKLLQQAEIDFSTELRSLLLPPGEIGNKSFQVATAVEKGTSGGTFTYFTFKKLPSASFLLFLMGEATPGIELAALMSLSQGSMEQDTKETEPEFCMQYLTSKIQNTFGRELKWKYCFCSLNLSTGELKWKSSGHPGPSVGNVMVIEAQTTSLGKVQLHDEDYIVLHSEQAHVRYDFQAALKRAPAASEFLKMIQPENNLINKDYEKKTINTFDQSYLVVKWRSLE